MSESWRAVRHGAYCLDHLAALEWDEAGRAPRGPPTIGEGRECCMATISPWQPRVGLVLMACVMSVLACNMAPAIWVPGADLIEELPDDGSEALEPEPPSPDLQMMRMNDAMATLAADMSLMPSAFSCVEQSGSMVKYLDDLAKTPNMDANSLVSKEFDFTLAGKGPATGGMFGEGDLMESEPYMRFGLDWDLSWRVLAPVVRTAGDGSRELVAYVDKEGFEEGNGDGLLYENGLFIGELGMWSQSRDDGEAYGEREYTYEMGGAYDPVARQMLLCVSWEALSESSLVQMLTGGPWGVAPYCSQAGLNYFVCSPSG